MVGAAIADELASRDSEVRVFDPREPGGGATQASAGMLAPYIDEYGPALLALCEAGFERYRAFLDTLEQRSGQPIEHRCDGSWLVALGEAGLQEIERTLQRLKTAGIEHELADGGALRRHEPGLSPAIEAGLCVGPHGYVQVDALISSLVRAATSNGARFERAAVDAVEGGRDVAAVIAAGERVEADAVIVASGSWAGRLPGAGPALPVRPVRGQLLRLRFPEPPISRIVWSPGCYLVPWLDGTILLGATVENAGFDERATAAGVGEMLRAGTEILPALGEAAVDGIRVGLRPGTPDGLPVVGRSSTMPRVFHATGHYRNGVLLAPLTAALVADLVLDGREDAALEHVRPARFGL